MIMGYRIALAESVNERLTTKERPWTQSTLKKAEQNLQYLPSQI